MHSDMKSVAQSLTHRARTASTHAPALICVNTLVADLLLFTQWAELKSLYERSGLHLAGAARSIITNCKYEMYARARLCLLSPLRPSPAAQH